MRSFLSLRILFVACLFFHELCEEAFPSPSVCDPLFGHIFILVPPFPFKFLLKFADLWKSLLQLSLFEPPCSVPHYDCLFSLFFLLSFFPPFCCSSPLFGIPFPCSLTEIRFCSMRSFPFSPHLFSPIVLFLFSFYLLCIFSSQFPSGSLRRP